MARVELKNLGLSFWIRRRGRVAFKDFLVQRLFRKSVNAKVEIQALDKINLSIGQGQRLGVIGHNGAGKSTLLKVLAGIYPPSHGTRIVEGRISSLFEIALGFEPDASGWENIAFRGYLQGETPDSIRSKMDEIADFSELGDFLEMPVRYYSAGMSVRLAFSIATAIEPEILLIDEVLSAGDLAFQQKARQRMTELIDKAQVLVLVSHDLESVAATCNQVVWMDHGRIHQIGPVETTIHAYRESRHQESRRAA